MDALPFVVVAVLPWVDACAWTDVRANENLPLAAMHTLFVREHNRRCNVLKAANPTWGDEQLYQSARRFVIALIQVGTTSRPGIGNPALSLCSNGASSGQRTTREAEVHLSRPRSVLSLILYSPHHQTSCLCVLDSKGCRGGAMRSLSVRFSPP